MKICFISTEIFAWGKHGGFGRATRLIGSQLAARGFDVSAVVPARDGQNRIDNLDGIKVHSYPIHNPFASMRIIKEINADIYHSQEPSFGTCLAQISSPQKKHVITFRDTRMLKDWIIEFQHPSLSRLQVFSNFIFENNFFVTWGVKKAEGQYAAAEFLSEVARKKYKLNNVPGVLRSPVEVAAAPVKAVTPTAVYLGRLDKRKRPEKFLELAPQFPEVDFLVMGKSRNKNYNDYLVKKYSGYSNLKFLGFVDQFSSKNFDEVLSRSWIMINTSLREGLPNSFIEGMAHKCAILSSVNPDNVTGRFGMQVKDDDYAEGLRLLLKNSIWKEKAELGYEFVKENFCTDKVICQHIQAYNKLLKN